MRKRDDITSVVIQRKSKRVMEEHGVGRGEGRGGERRWWGWVERWRTEQERLAFSWS